MLNGVFFYHRHPCIWQFLPACSCIGQRDRKIAYDKQVTDTPAYDETVIDKLVCTTCGATKDAPQATSDAAK